MSKYIVVGLDGYNNYDPHKGMLEFAMDGDNPVPGSLRTSHCLIPPDVIRNIRFWAIGSMDSVKYRNIELKAENGMLWFVTDSYRLLDRGEIFDTLYQGSELASHSIGNNRVP